MIIAVIPAYNEEKTIGDVLKEVQKHVDKVVVVNDGSTDKTAEISRQYGAEVLSHVINRGLGAALRTGFAAALGLRNLKVAATDLKNNDVDVGLRNLKVAATDLKNNDVVAGFSLRNEEGLDIIITLDADGQHDPDDIPKLIEPIKNGNADAVIGSRFIQEKQNSCHSEPRLWRDKLREESRGSAATHEISADRPSGSREILPLAYRGGQDDTPLFRKIANWLGNAVTYLFFGIWVTDSQSGFRAFSREALKKLNLKSSGMAVSSEIIKEIKRNRLRFEEIPIKPVYTKYSMSKGQNLFEGVKTLYHLFLRKIE